jgi:leucyl aminopeptidase
MSIVYQQGKLKELVKPATVVFVAPDAAAAGRNSAGRKTGGKRSSRKIAVSKDNDRIVLPFRALIAPHLKSGAFKAEKPEILPLYQGDKSWLLLAGLPDLTPSALLEATARAANTLNSLNLSQAAFVVPSYYYSDPAAVLEQMAVGLTLALDQRPSYKGDSKSNDQRNSQSSDKGSRKGSSKGSSKRTEERLSERNGEAKGKSLKDVVFQDVVRGISLKSGQEIVDRSQLTAGAQLRARVLIDRPANLLYPELLAREALKLENEYGLSVTVWDEEKLAQEGAGAILAVGSGSVHPPRMVVLEYTGPGLTDRARPVALVGKGITFDSGGLCLKPPENMAQMKTDMSGAAVVLSTVLAASELKMPVRLVGVIPLAENLPSGSSFRPGDIVRSLSGHTVEIMNTDAEGRLILCDALTLAQRYQPTHIIDLATLTGACLVALGENCAGLFSNDKTLTDGIMAAGHYSGEDYWPMPLFKAYDDRLKSELADFRESSTRAGGAIIGALFLNRFISGRLPWAHLDIVGTSRNAKSKPGFPEGATGFGVRTLLKFLEAASGLKPAV